MVNYGKRHRFRALHKMPNFQKRAHEAIQKPNSETNAKIDVRIKFYLGNCFLKFQNALKSLSGHDSTFLLLKIQRVRKRHGQRKSTSGKSEFRFFTNTENVTVNTLSILTTMFNIQTIAILTKNVLF